MKNINPNGSNTIYWRTGKGGTIEVLLQKSATRKINFWEISGGEVEDDETFGEAASRESRQEIGFACHPQLAEMVAVLQQRKKVAEIADHYVIGTVVVFAVFADIDPQTLTLQSDEVSEVRWWPIEEALRAKDGDAEEWIGLGYLRMLAHFFNHCSTRKIYDSKLSSPVRVVTSDGILTI